MNDFIISVLKGFYPYFAIPALIVVAYRIRKRLWTTPETLLLLFVIMHFVLEALQILIGARTLYMSRRYLLPCAPLLFGWCAWGFAEIFHQLKNSRRMKRRFIIYTILSGMAVLLIIDGLMPTIKSYTSSKKKRERKIVETLAPLLHKDYDGIRFNPHLLEATHYQPPFRPLVASEYPALGYWSGGSHVGEDSRYDYLVRETSAPQSSNVDLKFEVEISGRLYGIYTPREATE